MRALPAILLLHLLIAIGGCDGHGHEAAWRAQIATGAPSQPTEDISETEYPLFSEGIFPCSRCHLGGSPAAAPERGFPHRLHLDSDMECADCHFPADDAEPVLPTREVCADCHEDPEGESEAFRAYFASVLSEGGEFRFARRWRTRDALPAHPRHAQAGVGCSACHGEPTDLPFVKPKSVPLMALCMACHEERKAPRECATCHREIRDPQHLAIVLDHAEEQRGCLDCHNPADRDTVRLANGSELPFEQSYLLCGQCHGPKLRDWRLGLHGKRTGSWSGHKKYLLCVHCHNPHAPSFPEMALLPRPARPEEIR